jgi:transcriptional regulator with XRE-family HTH domain
MEIQERLQLVMKMNNLNASQFADRIGVQRSSISHMLTGRNKPSLDLIQKTLAHFPRVNADWLLTGKVKEQEEETTLKSLTSLVKEEDSEFNDAKVIPENKNLQTEFSVPSNESEIEKIIWFYTDGSYRIFSPSK